MGRDCGFRAHVSSRDGGLGKSVIGPCVLYLPQLTLGPMALSFFHAAGQYRPPDMERDDDDAERCDREAGPPDDCRDG